MTKPKGFKKYFLLVRNETPAFFCQLGNREGKVIVWVVGAVGGAAMLWGQGDAPHGAGPGNWGISGPGAADQSMDSQHGLRCSLQCSTKGCSAKGLARNPALGLRVIAQKSFTELMCFYEKK